MFFDSVQATKICVLLNRLDPSALVIDILEPRMGFAGNEQNVPGHLASGKLVGVEPMDDGLDGDEGQAVLVPTLADHLESLELLVLMLLEMLYELGC